MAGGNRAYWSEYCDVRIFVDFSMEIVMSKLEDIVPPLELCKRIPAGAFEDSVLVWVFDHQKARKYRCRLFVADGKQNEARSNISSIGMNRAGWTG